MEDYIERIIDGGDINKMHELSEILEELLEGLKKTDEELYKEYELELYEMAYGRKLNEEMAEEIVSKMRPYRKRWTIGETRDMQMRYGATDIDEIDFFVVINSAYNDYRDIFQDNIEDYVMFTIDFIRDEDAKADKVFLYFTTIVEE